MATHRAIDELISEADNHCHRLANQLLHTFSFVPDDKLHWMPSPSARSAIQIVAHCGVANKMICRRLRNQPEEATTREEMMEKAKLIIDSIQTREEAVELLQQSVSEVSEALQTLTQDSLDIIPQNPIRPLPMLFWMFQPGNHMMGHAYQIDYLETIWGDMEFRVAPPKS